MPLVVPALRLFVVFLNVYETFKTLKPPPPSARRGGQPSVRAISQRKRDLKGCLAVWVVWCCYAVYERTFDRVVGIFLPFYSEIKSVFLLFLVLTRAKGAEPLFLHLLRPFLKPYAIVVDPMLELSRDIGDFFFALLQVPLDYITSSPRFFPWHTGELEEEPGKAFYATHINSSDLGGSTRASSHSDIPTDHSATVRTCPVQNKRHGSFRSVSDNQRSDSLPLINNTSRDRHTSSVPVYNEHPSLDPPQYSQSSSRFSGHQIWYPPVPTCLASNHESPALALPRTAPEYHSSEWRTYPAFPSAYPPTPLPSSASLPSPVARRPDNDRLVISDSGYPPIPEDEQGFGKLLGRQHEGHPGSVHSPSNISEIHPGVNSYHSRREITREQEEDTLLDDSMCSSEAGLSEDDFGASLRTPHRSSEAMLSSAYSSVDSLTSALTTTDNAFSLRTKVSSDSLSSGSSFLAGRKRTHEAFQGKARNTLSPQSRNATLRGRVAPHSILKDPLQSSPSECEDPSGPSDDEGSALSKRQRVLDPIKRKSTLRPAARGVGSTRKSLPSRSVTARGRGVSTASQATLRSRKGSVTTKNSTIEGRKSTLVSRQVVRGGPQGIVKSSSTSSSQSGTLKGRAP